MRKDADGLAQGRRRWSATGLRSLPTHRNALRHTGVRLRAGKAAAVRHMPSCFLHADGLCLASGGHFLFSAVVFLPFFSLLCCRTSKKVNMKFGFWLTAMSVALCLMVSACDDESDNVGGGADDGSAESSKEVTYLLYMVGENDLSDFLNWNISGLMTGYESVGIDANVLVYADTSSVPELYLISKNRSGTVQKTTVKTYPDQYSVDPEVMKKVITDVFSRYPSEHRGITFSSHADGSLYHSNTVRTRAFGAEGSANYTMNITDIRKALDGGPYFDVLMFDACMMASVETAYELRENGHYLLAAPNSVPGEGFPYARLLSDLLQMDADGLSEVCRKYMDYFQTNDETWDDFASVSLTDLTQLDSLAVYMDSLFQSPSVQRRPWEINRNDLQHFESGYELYDYGEWVDSLGLQNAYVERVRRQLDRAVIYKAHGEYVSMNDYTDQLEIPVRDETFCGLNTYVPWRSLAAAEWAQMAFFTTLQWYRDAGFWRSSLYNLYDTEQ